MIKKKMERKMTKKYLKKSLSHKKRKFQVKLYAKTQQLAWPSLEKVYLEVKQYLKKVKNWKFWLTKMRIKKNRIQKPNQSQLNLH